MASGEFRADEDIGKPVCLSGPLSITMHVAACPVARTASGKNFYMGGGASDYLVLCWPLRGHSGCME